MAITERGRWASSTIDERGKFINNGITEQGQLVFNITGVPADPTTPPTVTIISVEHEKISNQTGINSSIIKFKFDTDVTAWSVNVLGSDSNTGVIADSGGGVKAGIEISAVIDWTELYQEGQNRINIYGQNAIGWTTYEEDPNAHKNYYLSLDGVDDYIQFISGITDIYIDVSIIGNSGTLYNNASGSDFPDITWNGTSFENQGNYIQNFTTSETGSTNPAFDINISKNKRMTIHAWNTTAWSGTSYVGRTNWIGNSTCLSMAVYSIKAYNGTTLVAHYDMSTGTVNDVSGNGNHATLIGGTWVAN